MTVYLRDHPCTRVVFEYRVLVRTPVHNTDMEISVIVVVGTSQICTRLSQYYSNPLIRTSATVNSCGLWNFRKFVYSYLGHTKAIQYRN